MSKQFADLCQVNAWDVVPYISIDKERITRDYVEKLKILPLAGICTNYPIELGKILNANDTLPGKSKRLKAQILS